MKTAELADQHSKHDHFVYMVKWVPRNAQQGVYAQGVLSEGVNPCNQSERSAAFAYPLPSC